MLSFNIETKLRPFFQCVALLTDSPLGDYDKIGAIDVRKQDGPRLAAV